MLDAHPIGTRAIARVRRSEQLRPMLAITTVFIVSRIALWLAGVRFDTSTLATFWQIADPELLRHHLLQSLWNLHSQPPLFNLWLGVNLKLFPHHLGGALQLQFLACGLALALLLNALLVRITGARRLSALLACLFTVSPAVLLYENFLFYEYPVVVMLLGALLAVDRFARRPTVRSGTVFFTLVAMIVYTRSTFQLPWVALVLALLLWRLPNARRAVLVSAAVPVVLIAALSLKNEIEFGVPSTSSWAGMNLAQVAFIDLSPAMRAHLIADGTLSATAAIPAFSTLAHYPSFLKTTRHTGIPILDDRTAHGVNNFNNLAYVAISNRYLSDALSLIESHPGIYLDGVGGGLELAARPSEDDPYLSDHNRSQIAHWDALFDDVVLLRLQSVSRTSWTIVIAYIAAALYGLRLLARRPERHGDRLPMLLVAVGTLLYVAFVVTFGEVNENQRLRFCLDPLVLALLAAGGVELRARIRPKPSL